MSSSIETERILLRQVEIADAKMIRNYLLENKEFLKAWEPNRDESYFDIANIEKQIKDRNIEIESGKAIIYYVFLKTNNELIGNIGITNIVYGSFLSGFLGYKLCEKYINNGYMTEALEKVIEIAFKEKGLHRIEANVMPRNIRSRKVLEKLGFENEGRSKRYLRINGVWEDHDHYVILNDDIE